MYVYIASYRVVRFYTEIFGRKFGHVIDLSRELVGSSPIFGGKVSSYSRMSLSPDFGMWNFTDPKESHEFQGEVSLKFQTVKFQSICEVSHH